METPLQCTSVASLEAGWHARMSSRLAGKGACALLHCQRVTNIRLRPSLREVHRATRNRSDALWNGASMPYTEPGIDPLLAVAVPPVEIIDAPRSGSQQTAKKAIAMLLDETKASMLRHRRSEALSL